MPALRSFDHRDVDGACVRSAVRSGARGRYIVAAVDRYGREVNVVLDAHDGQVIAVRPIARRATVRSSNMATTRVTRRRRLPAIRVGACALRSARWRRRRRRVPVRVRRPPDDDDEYFDNDRQQGALPPPPARTA